MAYSNTIDGRSNVPRFTPTIQRVILPSSRTAPGVRNDTSNIQEELRNSTLKRMETFDNLRSRQQLPFSFVELAQDGFYFDEPSDSMVCAYCLRRVSQWRRLRTVIELSGLHSPSCTSRGDSVDYCQLSVKQQQLQRLHHEQMHQPTTLHAGADNDDSDIEQDGPECSFDVLEGPHNIGAPEFPSVDTNLDVATATASPSVSSSSTSATKRGSYISVVILSQLGSFMKNCTLILYIF